MTERFPSLILAAAVLGGSLFAAQTASAHISLERGGTHKSRYGDDEQKQGVCGRVGGTRGTNIYTYEPGETITVKVSEFIPHPGYFRFAFDTDGDDGFLDPRSIKPIDPKRKCPFNEHDQCGKSDFYNNETVLPGLDNLEPHLSGGQKTYTFQVKLPNVECDNCTLQIIQVMEDTVHGAYNTSEQNPDGSLEDVYHQCIDIVLKRKTGGDAGVRDAGAADAGRSDAGADAGLPCDINPDAVEDEEELANIEEGDGPEASSEGCSLGGAANPQAAGWFLLGLGALVARARRNGRRKRD